MLTLLQDIPGHKAGDKHSEDKWKELIDNGMYSTINAMKHTGDIDKWFRKEKKDYREAIREYIKDRTIIINDKNVEGFIDSLEELINN